MRDGPGTCRPGQRSPGGRNPAMDEFNLSLALLPAFPRLCRLASFAGWFSEWDDGGQQADWVSAACKGPAEVDGVKRQVLGLGELGVVGVSSAGGAGEIESEGFAMAARPFSNDVGDDAAVV